MQLYHVYIVVLVFDSHKLGFDFRCYYACIAIVSRELYVTFDEDTAILEEKKLPEPNKIFLSTIL